jgi:hypothetical protein
MSHKEDQKTCAHVPMSAGGVTSAIDTMSVPEVRKTLGKLRMMPQHEIWLCDLIVGGGGQGSGGGPPKMIAEFTTDLELGHHMKRHKKSLMKDEVRARAAVPHSGSQGLSAPPGCPGPKGDAGDPFPFSRGWRPQTLAGMRAFHMDVSDMEEETTRAQASKPTSDTGGTGGTGGAGNDADVSDNYNTDNDEDGSSTDSDCSD